MKIAAAKEKDPEKEHPENKQLTCECGIRTTLCCFGCTETVASQSEKIRPRLHAFCRRSKEDSNCTAYEDHKLRLYLKAILDGVHVDEEDMDGSDLDNNLLFLN
jgi:hypothetical protein